MSAIQVGQQARPAGIPPAVQRHNPVVTAGRVAPHHTPPPTEPYTLPKPVIIKSTPAFFRPNGNCARTENDRVIVNCGINSHYSRLTKQAIHFYAQHCADTYQFFWTDLPEGCPTHAQQNYAFKLYAIQAAVNAGFRYILWADSTFRPIASLAPLWQWIEDKGWFAPPQSWLADFCNDAALAVFDVTKEQARSIPLVFSGLVGLDMQGVGAKIFGRWKHYYMKGTFQGIRPPHRHDESALSFVLHELKLVPTGSGFSEVECHNGFIISRNF